MHQRQYNNDYRWISHDDFDKLKGCGDLLVDCCFSFGLNWRKGYAYSREIEPYKKALHYAILFGDYTLANELFGIDFSCLGKIDDIEKRYSTAKAMIKSNDISNMPKGMTLDAYSRLLNLECLHRLYDLPSLERGFPIFATSLSYDEVRILPNSVIYCDIPYRSTSKYNEIEFDYDRFYSWALSQTEPIFISEYEMPNDFICIASKNKKSHSKCNR